MANDTRYRTLKVMIETGNVKSFDEIFNIVPKTVVAANLGINYSRFLAKVKRPENFSLKDFLKLSSFMEADNLLIIKLALQDIEKRVAPKKKKA